MSIILMPDQVESVGNTRVALRTYNSVLLQSPTGSGKTVMASDMSKTASGKGAYVFFICHRQELVDQTAKTFSKFGLDYGIIAAGWPVNYASKVQICSIDTLKNRLDKVPYPNLVIWDEAHHVAAGGWAKVKTYYSKAKHIGLSATPERLDGKGLAEYFDYMVLGPAVAWLIENKRLADYRIFQGSAMPDMKGVHKRMGDFVKSESAAVMDNNTITGGIVKHWLKHARHKKTIGFAVSIELSQKYCEEFRRQGITAVHLDGKTPKPERRAVAKAFAEGDIDVLWNVGLFSEGYDLAAQADMDVTIDAVIDAAPTQSLAQWLQRAGRALRVKSDGSDAIILDHAGNATRHGLPDDDRKWNLNGKKAREENEEASIATRQCKECFAIHRPAPKCPQCGYEYVVEGRQIEEVEQDMVEMDKATMRRKERQEQASTKDLDGLIALGKKRGYKNPEKWAAHIMTARRAKEIRRYENYP